MLLHNDCREPWLDALIEAGTRKNSRFESRHHRPALGRWREPDRHRGQAGRIPQRHCWADCEGQGARRLAVCAEAGCAAQGSRDQAARRERRQSSSRGPEEPAPRPATLVELRAGRCKFPVSDPPPGHGVEMLFCAAPVAQFGANYCELHEFARLRGSALRLRLFRLARHTIGIDHRFGVAAHGRERLAVLKFGAAHSRQGSTIRLAQILVLQSKASLVS